MSGQFPFAAPHALSASILLCTSAICCYFLRETRSYEFIAERFNSVSEGKPGTLRWKAKFLSIIQPWQSLRDTRVLSTMVAFSLLEFHLG
jgi:hypothetical protein